MPASPMNPNPSPLLRTEVQINAGAAAEAEIDAMLDEAEEEAHMDLLTAAEPRGDLYPGHRHTLQDDTHAAMIEKAAEVKQAMDTEDMVQAHIRRMQEALRALRLAAAALEALF